MSICACVTRCHCRPKACMLVRADVFPCLPRWPHQVPGGRDNGGVPGPLTGNCVARKHPWCDDVPGVGDGAPAVAAPPSLRMRRGLVAAATLLTLGLVGGLACFLCCCSAPSKVGAAVSASLGTLQGPGGALGHPLLYLWLVADALFRSAAYTGVWAPGSGAAAQGLWSFLHELLLMPSGSWPGYLMGTLIALVVVIAFVAVDARKLLPAPLGGGWPAGAKVVPVRADSGVAGAANDAATPARVGAWATDDGRGPVPRSRLAWVCLGVGRLGTSPAFLPLVYLLWNPWLCDAFAKATAEAGGAAQPVSLARAYYMTGDCGECFFADGETLKHPHFFF
jgi:hypothetical protein